MERHGTDDIPIRVQHLESSVDRLHNDNQNTQRTLAGVVAQLDSLSRLMTDVAGKLDRTRTQKPNVGTIAAVVSVLITLSILAFAPVYREMSRSHEFHEWTTKQVLEYKDDRIRDAEREADHLREELARERLLSRAGR